jgi:transposase
MAELIFRHALVVDRSGERLMWMNSVAGSAQKDMELLMEAHGDGVRSTDAAAVRAVTSGQIDPRSAGDPYPRMPPPNTEEVNRVTAPDVHHRMRRPKRGEPRTKVEGSTWFRTESKPAKARDGWEKAMDAYDEMRRKVGHPSGPSAKRPRSSDGEIAGDESGDGQHAAMEAEEEEQSVGPDDDRGAEDEAPSEEDEDEDSAEGAPPGKARKVVHWYLCRVRNPKRTAHQGGSDEHQPPAEQSDGAIRRSSRIEGRRAAEREREAAEKKLQDEAIRVESRAREVAAKRWQVAANKIYIECVRLERAQGITGLQRLCSLVSASDSPFLQLEQNRWIAEAMQLDMRDNVVRDFDKAYNTTLKKFRLGKIRTFAMHFPKCHQRRSVVVRHKNWRATWQRHSAEAITVKSGNAPPQVLNRVPHDTRVVMEPRGVLRFDVLVDVDPKPCTSTHAVALDVGVRTFLQGYDPAGEFKSFGEGDIRRVDRLFRHLDALSRKLARKCVSREEKRHRAGCRKAAARLRQRIHDLVSDLHHRVIHQLLTRYKLIILAKFSPGECVRRNRHTITPAIRRRILVYRHGEFRQKLLQAAKQYDGVAVVVLGEEWTSKRCSRCHCIHELLGGSKLFVCPNEQCGLVIDRDCNAARNLWDKFLFEKLQVPWPVVPPTQARNALIRERGMSEDMSSAGSLWMDGDQKMSSVSNRAEVPCSSPPAASGHARPCRVEPGTSVRRPRCVPFTRNSPGPKPQHPKRM